MIWRTLADVVLVLHLAFAIFAGIGGLLVLRWPRLWRIHVPCAVWGALIMFAGWICPLTPLENGLRRRGGQAGYEGGFIEHYVVSVLYPRGLTRGIQFGIGAGVVIVNAAVYGSLIARARRRRERIDARAS
ncbi:DUF2784 domain-containing protein [Longimicrobium sp.]|uniref:DUF2784 domain-containing protein n=1 Tax=Longimicrobium sp. TaxID=2029185 RepID=UPI002E32690D|nr:DUF2784 domain-containing protein [Longimicrobium sp.]HEX6040167.1 DUF2784 domain-containing protein [Longimicrobium sp.]